ncbi:MAG: hypothetical protein GF331_10775 [Chitinivibrionales bacterium]|nr:hypothetical protein [Chitinivibrionales bacterium]
MDTLVRLDRMHLGFWRRYSAFADSALIASASDTNYPRELRVPAYGEHHDWFAGEFPERCAFETGKTATFVLLPDARYGSRAFRIRTDEHARDFGRVASLDTGRIAWLTTQSDVGHPGSAKPILDFGEPHMTPEGLLLERYREESGVLITQCYRILSDGQPVELRAAPRGVTDSLLVYYHLDNAGNAYRWDDLSGQVNGLGVWIGSSGAVYADGHESMLSAGALDTLRDRLDAWAVATAARPDTAHLRGAGAEYTMRRYLLQGGDGRFVFSTDALGCDAAAALSGVEGFLVAHGIVPPATSALMPGTVERYVRIFCYSDGSVTYGADTVVMSYAFSECGAWEVREYFSPGSPLAAEQPDTNRFVLRISPERMTVENAMRTPQVYGRQALAAGGIPVYELGHEADISFSGWEPDTGMVGHYVVGHSRDLVLGGLRYSLVNVLINGTEMTQRGCAELFIFSKPTEIVRVIEQCNAGIPASAPIAASGWQREF